MLQIPPNAADQGRKNIFTMNQQLKSNPSTLCMLQIKDGKGAFKTDVYAKLRQEGFEMRDDEDGVAIKNIEGAFSAIRV